LAEARDLMEEAQADLQSGASFVEVADARTEDPSNAFGDEKKGGDLGFLRREQLDITFADAAWELADGEITTEPVETMYGLHLIQRTESRIVTDKNSAGEDEQIEEVRVRHLLIRTRPTTADPFIYLANFKQTGLTGKQLRKAVVVFDQITGEPQVSVQFNSEGTELFAQITERNIGDEVGIFLDGSPVSIPVVNQEISSGEAVISGSFTVAEAKQLVRDLNAGALPVPVSLVNQQQVGATLGDEAVQKSVFAGLIGVVAVIIFMIMWYRLPGVVASLALVLYALVVLAIYILWPVTLTLSGIAGFLLSVGMAVDANILIFERMKEELRGGRSLDMAVREGFARAWPSIRDSNVSSLITCALLLFIGTGLVKGFALTLAIGIVVSMFSAITATRYILYAVVRAKSRTWWFGVRSSSSS
jgi:preprotein translocase subunit SecD